MATDLNALLRKAEIEIEDGLCIVTTCAGGFPCVPAGTRLRISEGDTRSLSDCVSEGMFGVVDHDADNYGDLFASIVPDLADRATFLLVCDEAEQRGIFEVPGAVTTFMLSEVRACSTWNDAAFLRPMLTEGLVRALADTREACGRCGEIWHAGELAASADDLGLRVGPCCVLADAQVAGRGARP